MTAVITMFRNDSPDAPIFVGSESLKLVSQSSDANVVVLSGSGNQHAEPTPAASAAAQATVAIAPTDQAPQTPFQVPEAVVVECVADVIAAQRPAASVASDQVPICAQVQTKVEAAPLSDAIPAHALQRHVPIPSAVNQHITKGPKQLTDTLQEYQSTQQTVAANITMPPNPPQVTRTTTAVSTQRSGRQVAI